ncbi:hypothetical protein BpHYR1_049830 [Brachionus plicatilis]|uniref:Uncharacterized protein n=1 Tax=Brachionus plicatilis TaxID=10195 RepID=A0A3M7SFW5_BRAPC|nr:hypothetical protein BpHYR1_049830 [Brachionus plicatilis]
MEYSKTRSVCLLDLAYNYRFRRKNVCLIKLSKDDD